MEDIIESVMNGNNRFQWEILQENEKIEIDHTIPRIPILILTCMDSRIDVHRIFQLKPGDVFVLRNAGNQFTEDVLRSILLAIHEHDVKFIIVLGHTDCGMKKIRLDELRYKLTPQALKEIGQYSINYQYAIQRFFKTFTDEITNINNQVDRLKLTKGIPSDTKIVGMLYDPYSGWVFHEKEFQKYNSYRIFMHKYQDLLQQKKISYIDFLETIESEILGAESIESEEIMEIEEEFKEGNGDLNIKKEIDTPAEYQELQKILDKNTKVIENSIKIVSNIQIPKIYIPKIRVHIPGVNKNKIEE
ncbi:MAG: beta-class carbonic anhydrase [Promethearchaeota archaeon]|jgi:carbonic anhydrase